MVRSKDYFVHVGRSNRLLARIIHGVFTGQPQGASLNFTHIFWASIVLVLNEMVLVLVLAKFRTAEHEYEYRPAD